MNRLIDDLDHEDEARAEQARLVAALRGRPLPPHLDARVRARIRGMQPRRRRGLRPLGALIALVALLFLSVASAMIVRTVRGIVLRRPAPSSAQRLAKRPRAPAAPVVTPLPASAEPPPSDVRGPLVATPASPARRSAPPAAPAAA